MIILPVLVMAGEKDPKFVAVGKAMQDLSPRIQSVTVRGSGHTIHEEKPGAFQAAIEIFIHNNKQENDAEH